MTAFFRAITSRMWIYFFSVSASIVFIEAWLARSDAFYDRPDLLSFAITFDLVLTIPLLYYLMVIRKAQVSWVTIVPVFIVFSFVARAVLPREYQYYLQLFRTITPALGIVTIWFFITRLRQIRSHYRIVKRSKIYSSEAWEEAIETVLGKNLATSILSFELFLVTYAFTGWGRRYQRNRDDALQFSYHKRGAYRELLGGMLMLLLMETIGLHIIISHWSNPIAWLLTISSIYGAIWLIGDYHSLRLHPIVLTKEHLHFRCGFRWRATIPLDNIRDVQPPSAISKKFVKTYLFGGPHVVLFLKDPVMVQGFWGIVKTLQEIAMSIDDPESFLSAITIAQKARAKLQHNTVD